MGWRGKGVFDYSRRGDAVSTPPRGGWSLPLRVAHDHPLTHPTGGRRERARLDARPRRPCAPPLPHPSQAFGTALVGAAPEKRHVSGAALG